MKRGYAIGEPATVRTIERSSRSAGEWIDEISPAFSHLTAQNQTDLVSFLRSLTDEEFITDARFSNPWR